MMRRKWFKAAEVLIEIVTRANDEDLSSVKERNTFRHQFILNYLNRKTPTERRKFTLSQILDLKFIDNGPALIKN